MTDSHSHPAQYVKEVRAQYEELPYPMRDFSREREMLYTSDHISLDGLNHAGWAGMRDFRKGARFLIAGQGTGDATVFLAEQLRGFDVEIVSIDLSTASIRICKERLAARGLTNVKVLHLSILDVPNAGLGHFDVIETSGVLHHLEDPQAGLNALTAVLADDGIMGIMVYAFYGRLAVYQLQTLMQYLLTPDMDAGIKVSVARAFLAALPLSHPMNYSKPMYREDLEDPSGGGIFDLLLHSTDRAYTMPQLYAWVENAGLVMGDFCAEWQGNMAYTPELYTRSALLRGLFAEKSEPERQTIAELMSSALNKHIFYVSKKPKLSAKIADDMVVSFGFRQRVFPNFIPELLRGLEPLAVGQHFEQPATGVDAPSLIISKRPHTLALLNLLSLEQPIGALIAQAVAQTGAKETDMRADFEQLYIELNSRRRVFLRHQSIAPYPQWNDIYSRLSSHPAQPISAA